MNRRTFFQLLAAAAAVPRSLFASQIRTGLPALRVVSAYPPAAAPGVPASQLDVDERCQNQMDGVSYAPHLPDGVQIVAAEHANRNTDNSGYDPAVYLEADLFGEDATRSNMMRLVSTRLTKIINIPN